MKKILVVCTGNLCRSPMAAALLTRRLADLGLGDEVAVSSAGTYTRDGMPASANARVVIERRGLSLADHRTRAISEAMLREADLILVMEERHRQSLFHLSPQALVRVFLLSEMAGRHQDVADPYGMDVEDYEATAVELDELLAGGMPRILKRLGLQAPANLSSGDGGASTSGA